MKSKICCVFNLAPHYRAPIYHLMDKELGCDFYLGDTLGNQIKLMDYDSLKGFIKTLQNVQLKKGFMWQKGSFTLIFKPYKHYIITGAPSILSNWVLLILAILLRKKVYAWTHGMRKPARTKGEIFHKVFYKLCYRVLLYGDFPKEVMLNEGFSSKKLVPIYNSLNYKKQLGIREQLTKTKLYNSHFNNDYPVIIYIGRLQKVKKLDLLVFALNKMLTAGTNCNLVLVGSDINNGEIFKMVVELGLEENVWLYGPCYDELEIGNLIYNADVCVSPGPIGLTALHALTYGCPVISNDNYEEQMPEHEVIFPKKNGAFFINENGEDLVRTVSEWINLPHDHRERVRNEAYRIIDEKWNPANQIRIIKNALDS